jgi:hypothetical protein
MCRSFIYTLFDWQIGTLSLVSKLLGSFEATLQLILKKELKKKVNKF